MRCHPVRSAFHSVGGAIRVALGLLVVASSPFVVTHLDPAGKYRGLPATLARGGFIAEELHKAEPLDVLVIGQSRVWSGIDTDFLQTQLPGVRAAIFAANASGPDMWYAMLHDALAHRTVKLLVLEADLHRNFDREMPHPFVSWWWDISYPSEGLGVRQRLALLGLSYIGAPRRLLGALRTGARDWPAISGEAGSLGPTNFSTRGDPPPPDLAMRELPVAETLIDPRDATRARYLDEEVTPFEQHCLDNLLDLARANGTRVVFVYLPRAPWRAEDGFPRGIQVPRWTTRLRDTRIMGVDLSTWTTDEIGSAFVDLEHLGAIGARRYMIALLPAFRHLLDLEAAP